jgi:hypothetical protein
MILVLMVGFPRTKARLDGIDLELSVLYTHGEKKERNEVVLGAGSWMCRACTME